MLLQQNNDNTTDGCRVISGNLVIQVWKNQHILPSGATNMITSASKNPLSVLFSMEPGNISSQTTVSYDYVPCIISHYVKNKCFVQVTGIHE